MLDYRESKGISEKHLLLFIDDAKAFDCVDHNKLWKTVKEMGILDHLICLLRNMYAGQEVIVRTRHGRIDWFQIEKSMTMIYCHPAYLTYMQSTSCQTLGWMNDKLESRLWKEIPTLRYDDITLMAESEEELKSLLMRVKESEKVSLKLNIQKN